MKISKNKIDKESTFRIMSFAGSLILFFVLLTSFFKGLSRLREGDRLIAKTNEKLAKSIEDNSRLEEQLKVTGSDEFIEKQLRNKLGLAKEGEIIIVLPEKSILKKLAPNIPEPEEYKPKPNYQKWLDLFI